MSPTFGDEMLRGRNPENVRRRDFGRRRRYQQSGFQHTDRPRSSSPELFNKDHNASHESLSHLFSLCVPFLAIWSAISFPVMPTCAGIHCRHIVLFRFCRSVSSLWHSVTDGTSVTWLEVLLDCCFRIYEKYCVIEQLCPEEQVV